MSESFEKQRADLVERMKRSGAMKSQAVEEAFLNVPRELFFPGKMLPHAYADSAFPIGLGQTISQPSTIAVMLEALDVGEGIKVLEVGAGSGYVIALLCELVGASGKVFGVELLHALKEKATENLINVRVKNFELKTGDGTHGWKEKAPFERIITSAASAEIPKPLIEQLKEAGKIVAPLGNSFTQEIVCLEKKERKLVEVSRECCFVFVPLKGNLA